MIDLRSDTVTTPTPDMLRAMTAAEVGDDVYSEDPSINRLEEEVAGILGKEAAVFTPSGSMANQIAIRLHTQPGDSVLCEEGSHTFAYEAGAGAAPGLEEREAPPATASELEGFYRHLESALSTTGFLNPERPRQLKLRLRRIFQRSGLDRNEVNILRGALTALQDGRKEG